MIGALLITIAPKRGQSDLATQSPDCKSCHYNLTGNESGICPECGKAIPEEQRQLLTQNANSELK